VVGKRAAALFLFFGLIAAACEGRASQSTSVAVDIEAVSRHAAMERLRAQADAPPKLTTDTVAADGDDVRVATNLNQVTSFGVTKLQAGSAGSALNVSTTANTGSVVVGDQLTNVARVAVGGSTVSVISNLSSSSNVSVTSSSSVSDGSSVVTVSVATGSGSVNRTLRFDGVRKFVLRVTAEADGVPVIQVEEVGP
jgi:hypothetical protein